MGLGSMANRREVVITGIGVVSPLGVGHDTYWSAISSGRSGIRALSLFDTRDLPLRVAGEVSDFDPKQYVQPRKSLKFMIRETTFAVAAAKLAREDAGLGSDVDPDRFGIVLGADPMRNELPDIIPGYRESCDPPGNFQIGRFGTVGMAMAFPLGMLKVLPNMPACHISILHDTRSVNNTIEQGSVSSLLAIMEATRVIERGMADVVITGGTSSRLHPLDCVRSCLFNHIARSVEDPASACRPFDARRQGQVLGEGAGVLILESAEHAERRGANIWGRILGCGSAAEPLRSGEAPRGIGLHHAIRQAMSDAGLTSKDVGHVNAHGLATEPADRTEARVLNEMLPGVPVTAMKSYLGNLCAASGAVELTASLLGFKHGVVPPTLNYSTPDQECGLDVVAGHARSGCRQTAVAANFTDRGQAAAVVIGAA
jgi:3-oxoacyl-[acyl-carrier-protein] synthase II